ncbi:MAG TPA: radical SAM protein [Thermoanaerobaculia bacterium]|nr:radical SAM protein [Thermoanaerobaculia bacterium]
MTTKTREEIQQHAEQTLPSPEYVRISIAAAMAIGLKSGRTYRDVHCDCVNLLLNYPEGCFANCSYCGLARERPGLAQDNTFIRVGWPVFATDEVAAKVAEHEESVGRVCIAQVQDPRAYRDLIDVTERIRRRSEVPISALVMATLLDEEKLVRIRKAGADIIGVGLDAASEEVFYRTRGRGVRGPHSWAQHWEILRAARRLYGPHKVNAHVIVGLGETDRELIDLFYQLRSEQIEAYLFSFNPEPGTAMADEPRAPITRLRRIQLTKYLIEQRDLPREAIHFDAAGQIQQVRASAAFIETAIATGTPFMTNGCPDRNGKLACNRPFGSYRPGEEFRDYPFQPTNDDLAVIRHEARVEEIL